MLKWVLVVFSLTLWACTFDASSQAVPVDGEDEPFPPDAGPPVGGEDASGNVSPDEDAGDVTIPPTILNSETAIVRYFMNELDGELGDEPDEVLDAIGGPQVNLELNDPGDTASFVSVDSHRGVRFSDKAADARLSVALQNTKIRDALDGSPTGTLELVLDIADVSSDGGRLSHIGDGNEAGRFTLRASTTQAVEFYLNNFPLVSWPVDLDGGGRIVLHLVVDTTESGGGDRVRLYVNGQLRAPQLGLVPPKNTSLSISNAQGQFYALGNRETGGRGVEGTFYYAALYSGAMSAEVVANNATLLMSSDDSAQLTGQ